MSEVDHRSLLAGLTAEQRRELTGLSDGSHVLQVAAFDGRERLGGLIAVRLPENRWSACFGCVLNDKRKFPRGEGLLTTVTSTLAALASNMAVQLLTGVQAEFLRENNLFLIDLRTYAIEALAVERRSGCSVCGSD